MSIAPVSCFYASNRLTRRSIVTAFAAAVVAPSLVRTGVRAEAAVENGLAFATVLPNGVHLAIVVGGHKAVAFVADGFGRADRFEGTANRAMVLDSANGDRMTAAFDGVAFNGRVVKADKSAFNFSAEEASGVAGLYAVEVQDGSLIDDSGTDRYLAARSLARLPDQSVVVGGVITGSDGGARPLAAFISPDSIGLHWWIVQNDGTIAGGALEGVGVGYAGSHCALELSVDSLATVLAPV